MKDKKRWFLTALAFIPFLLFSSDIRRIILKYVAGPVVSDAKNLASTTFMGYEVTTGYNIYNEFIYASLILLAVFLIYSRVKKHGFSYRQIIAMTPFMAFGGMLRVVEDTGIVPFPYNILIISPIGYFLMLGIAFGFYRVSVYLDSKNMSEPEIFLKYSGTALNGILTAFFIYYGILNGVSDMYLLLTAVTAGFLVAVLGVQKVISTNFSQTLLNSTTGYMVTAGHALDGISSAFSIRYMGYLEKHPLSEMVMNLFGTPFAFTAFKVVFVMMFLGFMNKEKTDSLDRLILAGVIAVGLGPGVRNFVRAFLGV